MLGNNPAETAVKNSSPEAEKANTSQQFVTAHPWLKEHDEALLTFLEQGLSRNNIAKAMSKAFPNRPFTKNAVIGRIDRLGRSMTADQANVQRARAAREQNAKVPKRVGRPPTVARLFKESIAPIPVITVQELREVTKVARGGNFTGLGLKTLDELETSDCRWPLSLHGKTTFCGCKSVGNSPYCARHAAIAFKASA